MDLGQCIVRWSYSLKRPRTREQYALNLQQFLEWTAERGVVLEHPSDITRPLMEAWWHELKRRYGCARDDGSFVVTTQTAQQKWFSVASLLRWCTNEQVIDRNPCEGFLRGRLVDGAPRQAVSIETIQKLLAWASARAREPRPLVTNEPRQTASSRELAFILMATTGLRVTEVCSLRVQDFQEAPGPMLTVVGKGAKVNRIHIHADTARAIKRYLKANPKTGAEQLIGLHGRKGGKVNRMSIHYWLSEACDVIGIPRLTSHQFRSTLATHLHISGVPLVDIQRLLGHSDVSTTARYVHMVEEKRQAAALRVDVMPNGLTGT